MGSAVVKASKTGDVDIEKQRVSIREEIKVMFQSLDSGMDAKLVILENKFTSIFKELKEEMGNMKSNTEKNEKGIVVIHEKMEEYETSIDFNHTKIEERSNLKIAKAEKRIDKKIQELDDKLLMLEKQDRKYNFLFYGIPQEVNEKLYEKNENIFETDLRI